MKILFCASEAAPFAKEGGLADVVGSLPLELSRLGQEAAICLPFYKSVKKSGYKFSTISEEILYTDITKNIRVYFIRNDKYFGREHIYGDAQGDYIDNLERFSFFCQKALELIEKINFKPDIIHCNDWQTALIPVYIKTKYANRIYKGIKTLLTIHNLGYQGLFPKEQFLKLGLDVSLFSLEGLEFYGKVNLLKGGIIYADLLSTVSPTYAKEIQTQEFGFGLDGLMRRRNSALYGILNGIDYKIWNSASDKFIFRHYNLKNIKDKYANKEQLKKQCGINTKKDTILFGFVGRLAQQKGIDLFVSAAEEIARLEAQFIILGYGQEYYHNLLNSLAQKYPKKFFINIKFDEELAHRIYAGCDALMMPSYYEPCGLGQMISFRYATVPLVYATGGLSDTVNEGNGFIFYRYAQQDLLNAVLEAVNAYKNKEAWSNIMKEGLKLDFSWGQSAKRYLELYKRLINIR